MSKHVAVPPEITNVLIDTHALCSFFCSQIAALAKSSSGTKGVGQPSPVVVRTVGSKKKGGVGSDMWCRLLAIPRVVFEVGSGSGGGGGGGVNDKMKTRQVEKVVLDLSCVQVHMHT